ncbi:MAG: response regulator [Ignavibacteriae bacterium]|nr:response regulator [Ignavibacteriota bacterium]
MKTLVVDDDFASRLILQRLLKEYGEVHIAVNGAEALQAYEAAFEDVSPYDLVCLDIMMPGMDGQEVLRGMRSLEAEKLPTKGKRTHIVMTTALQDRANVISAGPLCDAYLVKPISQRVLLERLKDLGLIK